MSPKKLWALVCLAMSAMAVGLSAPTRLDPPSTVSGYVALLLVNETPFPGERGWVSEQDTKGGMLAILWVLESRLKHVPAGYRQEHIASERCDDVIDVITAGGEKGQCDGFYRDSSGRFVTVARVAVNASSTSNAAPPRENRGVSHDCSTTPRVWCGGRTWRAGLPRPTASPVSVISPGFPSRVVRTRG